MHHKMQKVGDICDGCRERRTQKELPLIRLVAADGKAKNGTEVPLCSFCDGDAVKISALGNHDEPQAA